MPPEQCPDCGRFLKAALVDGLVDAPAPCPKCGATLTAATFGHEVATAAAPVAASPGPSVRPPDLEPGDVRGAPDVLAGWDVGVPAGGPAVHDQRPFPADTVVVLGAGLLGFAVGVLAGKQRGRDATLGALGGLLGAGIARRIWRLP